MRVSIPRIRTCRKVRRRAERSCIAFISVELPYLSSTRFPPTSRLAGSPKSGSQYVAEKSPTVVFQALRSGIRYNSESMDEKPQETVSVEFAVGIGDGKFTATAAVPAGRANLTQILPVLQSLDDSLIGGVTAQLSQAGLTVSCKAGCGACCRQMVPLSSFEAEALSTWIRPLPEARQEELAGRFHQALLKLAAAGLIDRMVNEDWLAENEYAPQLALDYFYQRVPCPFLDADLCSI